MGRAERQSGRTDRTGDGVDSRALADLHGALDELRQEIRSRFAEERSGGAGSDRNELEALIATLRRRIGTLGMVERTGAIDEFGLDEDVLRRVRPLLDVLIDRYWRLHWVGCEHVPARGPCLLVANHSGVVPFDGLVLSHAIEREHPGRERPRFLVADWLLSLPFAHATLAQLGGVRACRENAERLLAAERLVIAFPEGGKGSTKVFRDRYRLQRFGRGGVVKLALERGAPIVPVGIVGAEEAHPLLAKLSVPARPLGLPFLPLTPTFPLLGPLGLLPLPSQWVIRIGEPMSLAGYDASAAADDLLVAELNEQLRSRVGALVDAALHDRESIWSIG